MDPGRIVIRALFGYVWAFILMRISGTRTIQQSDARCFVMALVLGDMFDDLFWAEIPVAQFVIGVSALLLAHLSATAATAGAGARIWRQPSKVPR
jgi:uncharacterized membrane protein YcaP (DUF421 family)